MQPTTNITGLPLLRLDTYSSKSTKRLFSDVAIIGLPIGKWSLIGFLITFSKISELSEALILYLVNSCANKPENLLKVLGILHFGLISIKTLFFVLM